MQTQGAIGNLINRYRAVLNKCRLLNVFGSLAVAGLLVMGGAGVALGASESLHNQDVNVTVDTYKDENNARGGKYNFRGSSAPSNITISDGTKFTDNTATATGCAIYSVFTNMDITGTEFLRNSATGVAPDGKAGALLFAGSGILNITNSKFADNTANIMGGAILDGAGTTANIVNTDFIGNKTLATGTDPGDFGGGAIYGEGSSSQFSTVNITGGLFQENESARSGGAIKADGKLSIDGTEFINNKSALRGGAIVISKVATDVSINSAKFTGNTANSEGGAIYINGDDGAGAVPALTFTGDNIFSNNKANNVANDIVNNSEVLVKSGTTDLQSGYQQATANAKLTVGTGAADVPAQLAAADMKLDDGTVEVTTGGALGNGTDIAGLQASLAEANTNGVDTTQGAYVGKKSQDLSTVALTVGNVTGQTTASDGNPVFGANSALLVDQTALNGDAAFTNVSTATMEDNSSVFVQNAKAGESVTLFENAQGEALTDQTGLTLGNNVTATTDNSMVTIDPASLASGKLSTQAANVSNVLPGLSPELGALVTANASTQGSAFLTRLTNAPGGTMAMSAKDAVTTLESAARVAAIAGVPQMTWAAQKAANAAVTQRTSLAAPASAGLQAVAADGSVQTGASAGDAMKNGFAMWIMPLYQSWNAWGMEGGNLDMDVNGALGGLAVGADYTFADAFRAGITVNMGGGYAEGSGDFNKTTNDFTFWGLGAYLGWSKDNFGLTADINHTWVYNDVEQDLAASMQMDTLKSDITSRALSAGLRGEYKLATDALDITPHVGVRYTHLTTDNYDVESGNATVLEGDTIHQGIWTFPIGVAFSKDVQMDSGWYVKPSLDVAVIPAAGDIKARGDVRFTGVPGSAEVSTQTMDYITYMGQAGLEFGNDNVKLGVNYNLQMGAQSTAHGVFGTLRYEF